MKYWIFQSNQVLGPYGPDDLCGLATFSAESLVCPEGRRGTSMGDWQRAGMLPDLSGALVKASQSGATKAPVLTLAGLPTEPALKDLSLLASLQEKTAMLEDAVLQMQESMRVKDVELAALHRELADKDELTSNLKRSIEERKFETESIRAEAQALKNETEESRRLYAELSAETVLRRQESARQHAESEEFKRHIAELEERVGEVRRISDAIDIAEKKVEHVVDESKVAQAAAIDDLAHQIEDVRTQLRQKTVMPEVADITPSLPAASVPPSTSVTKIEAPPLAILTANVVVPAPVILPSQTSVPGADFAALAPQPGSTAAPVEKVDGSMKPPFDSLVAKPASISVPSEPRAPADKRKKWVALAAVGGVLLVAFLLIVGRGGRGSPAVEPDSNPAASENSPAQTVEATTSSSTATSALPTNSDPAVGGPVDAPPSSPEPVVPDPRQAAVDAARNWKLQDGRTLGAALEALAPPSGNLSPWMPEPQASGAIFVSYFAPSASGAQTTHYEFEVAADGKTVTARNDPAKSVLTGLPVEPPAAPSKPRRGNRTPKAAKKKSPPADAVNPSGDPAKKQESLDELLKD